MIRLTECLYVGTSADESSGEFFNEDIGAVLNVAQDLRGTYGWPDGLDHMQVGLVDGPGNKVVAYCAAVLALVSLLGRNDKVLVYDHDGSRAVAVAIMYLSLVGGKVTERVDFMRRPGWEELVDGLGIDKSAIPDVHPAHKRAFYDIPFGLLEVI